MTIVSLIHYLFTFVLTLFVGLLAWIGKNTLHTITKLQEELVQHKLEDTQRFYSMVDSKDMDDKLRDLHEYAHRRLHTHRALLAFLSSIPERVRVLEYKNNINYIGKETNFDEIDKE